MICYQSWQGYNTKQHLCKKAWNKVQIKMLTLKCIMWCLNLSLKWKTERITSCSPVKLSWQPGRTCFFLPNSLTLSIMCTVFALLWRFATHIGNPKEPKLQHARDGPFYVIPIGSIVPQPVTWIFSHTWEGGAGQHQSSVSSKHTLQSSVGWRGGSK